MTALPVLEVERAHVRYDIVTDRVPFRKVNRTLSEPLRWLYRAVVPGQRIQVRAVDGVSLEIAEGETLALVGESGSGKTTLGRAIMQLERVVKGSIKVDGINVREVRGGRARRRLYRTVQMVFQDPRESIDPGLDVESIVAEPLVGLGIEHRKKARRARTIELLHQCGLPASLLGERPGRFSAGELQRVAICRALAPAPKLLVLDEPLSALDLSSQAQVASLLRQLQADLGLAMLLISHDLAATRHIAQRVAVMYFGQIVEVAPTTDLAARLLHPYARALISAVPQLSRLSQTDPRMAIQPSALSPPPGCRFHPRCAEATDRCRREKPKLKQGQLPHPVACHVVHDGA